MLALRQTHRPCCYSASADPVIDGAAVHMIAAAAPGIPVAAESSHPCCCYHLPLLHHSMGWTAQPAAAVAGVVGGASNTAEVSAMCVLLLHLLLLLYLRTLSTLAKEACMEPVVDAAGVAGLPFPQGQQSVEKPQGDRGELPCIDYLSSGVRCVCSAAALILLLLLLLCCIGLSWLGVRVCLKEPLVALTSRDP